MWWNGDAFHCGSGPRGLVHFLDIFFKVCHLLCLLWWQCSLSTDCRGAKLVSELTEPCCLMKVFQASHHCIQNLSGLLLGDLKYNCLSKSGYASWSIPCCKGDGPPVPGVVWA